MMRLIIVLLPYALLLLLAACSLIPAYQRPPALAPTRWKNADQKDLSPAKNIPHDWWRQFGNVELDRLESTALNNNLDIAVAKARVQQFRGLAKIAGAPLLPAVNAGGNYNFQEGNKNSTGINGSIGKTRWTGQWSVAYEVDLWGGIRAGYISANQQLFSARFTLDAFRLVVMADVAQSYFAIVGLKDRRQVAVINRDNVQEVMVIINARFEAGGASGLEVAQQQTELANAEAAIAQLDQQIAQAENALAVLLGLAPQQFKVIQTSLQTIQIPKAKTLEAASLLERRPDIKGAEADLMAAQADIGKARAAFYPRLQLGADNIFTAATATQPATAAVTLAAALTAPIFQGGRLQGELERTLGRRTELLETYRKTILTAYQEVEDALAVGKQTVSKREHLLISVASAQEAYQIAKDRYLAGATDYQTLLIVQRSLLAARDTEIQAHTDVLTAAVLLFKALGGGWS